MEAILFHGTGESPKSCWLPYLKENLEKRGYQVSVPALPNPEAPVLAESLPFALQNGIYDADTILVGHSSGATLILSILEKLSAPVRQAILVAGFFEPLDTANPEPILQETYDWEKIKSNCKEFVFINSDNDPWGCDDVVGKKLLEKLGGVLVVPKGEGHMGSLAYNQPYTEFPLLRKLID